MVLKFFETLASVSKYIEKEENEKGVKYVRRSVVKSFGSDSEFTWIRLFVSTILQYNTPSPTRHLFNYSVLCLVHKMVYLPHLIPSIFWN